MKRVLIVLLLLIIGMHKISANPTDLLNYEQSQIIITDIIRSIDSIWNLRDDEITRKVRLIDNEDLFYLTTSWAFLDDKTPFVVLNKFPYDFNSSSYIDLVTVKFEIQKGYLHLTIFSLIHKRCDEIPIIIVKSFKLTEKSIESVITEEIQILDDWDSIPRAGQ